MKAPSCRRPVVLLVEDHADTRMMYVEFLSLSFEVLTAGNGNGNEALETLRTGRPDLLITDLSFPGLDGFQLIARIREDPATSRLPIICLSGYGGHVHEQRRPGRRRGPYAAEAVLAGHADRDRAHAP